MQANRSVVLEANDLGNLSKPVSYTHLLVTIEERGFMVGIGVATGADSIFIAKDLPSKVEKELLLPALNARDMSWGGIITGISQNVTDFLGSLAVESIVGNSDFIPVSYTHLDVYKRQDWNDRKYCEIWRHEWEVIQNRYLEANNRPERVDLRSRCV